MEYLRNTWYVAMWSQDLQPGQVVGRKYLGDPVVLYRGADGVVAALADRCPHRFAPLSLGKVVDGCRIACGYHGLQFDASGTCVKNPHGHQRIPPASSVRSYPVVERHSAIWIWMGDRAADPSVIPDFGMLDEGSGHEVSRRDWLRMDASHELIVDNLMDLSHTAFLHEGILGNAETVPSEITFESTPTSVKVGRNAPDVPIPGFFDLMYRRDGRRVNYWADIRWMVPACLINDTGVTDVGAPRSAGTGIYGMHFLTPETDTTCWYHFAAARQNPIAWGEPVDTEIREKIAELRRYAFEEQDQVMIRAQQQSILSADPTQKPVILESDIGVERYKRILQGLMRAERAPA
jgi:vanillate O-demethylase monooxygenase subunit